MVVRVRVEIMGSHKCRIVGKSQSVLMMISPMIFTRTRMMMTVCAGQLHTTAVRPSPHPARGQQQAPTRTGGGGGGSGGDCYARVTERSRLQICFQSQAAPAAIEAWSVGVGSPATLSATKRTRSVATHR
eukprot:COSAG01_NODE_5977_length_3921_cov_3.697541_5_plen_130_part_00